MADLRTPCEEWSGARFASGYGRVGAKRAHRVVWEQEHGPIPPGMFVLHRCDNRPCVNIEHLYLGTHADNMRDRKERDRGVRGERVNTAKLTEAQVHEIRALCDSGVRHRDVAERFGISQALVSLIARREVWKRLPEAAARPTEAELLAQRLAKLSARKGRSWTPEQRAEMAARSKGNDYNKGRRPSAETRAKQSAARKKWWEARKASTNRR